MKLLSISYCIYQHLPKEKGSVISIYMQWAACHAGRVEKWEDPNTFMLKALKESTYLAYTERVVQV